MGVSLEHSTKLVPTDDMSRVNERGIWKVKRDTISPMLAIDTEAVTGVNGQLLARATVVDCRGQVVFDSFVRIHEAVLNYNTKYSGVRATDVNENATNALELKEVRNQVRNLMVETVVVGHDIRHDLRILEMVHPQQLKRDTFSLFKRLFSKPGLARLTSSILGVGGLQVGEHDSVQDARASLALYLRVANRVEKLVKQMNANNKQALKRLFKQNSQDSLQMLSLVQMGRKIGRDRILQMVNDVESVREWMGDDDVESVVDQIIRNIAYIHQDLNRDIK